MATVDLYPTMKSCEYCNDSDSEIDKLNLMIEVSASLDPIRIIICKKCIKKLLKGKNLQKEAVRYVSWTEKL